MKNLLSSDQRSSGVLLHVSSLPSPWGIGDLGAPARRFVDRLAAGGQQLWQLLPLNPTDAAAGDSPYFSSSSQAGNPLFISVEDLVERGYLDACHLADLSPAPEGVADFFQARSLKEPLLIIAADAVLQEQSAAYREFCTSAASWLDDHALFSVLKRAQNGCWLDWPNKLKYRDAVILHGARVEHSDEIEREKAIQFLFHKQWQALKRYANERQVALFGDMPIYVNTDSVDMWSAPEVFQLDGELRPRLYSGVPPDYFSATGQLWRNPVYDWTCLEEQNFAWWVRRLHTLLQRFDLLRIDHFRGLAQYWAVDADAEDAINGQWLGVPSRPLFDALKSALAPLPIVAEDLGTITPDVIALRDAYDLPGMVVLQFAFGDDYDDNPHKLINHRENSVAYLGTHDNTTALDWLSSELDDVAWQRLKQYGDCSVDAVGVRHLLDLLLASPARLAVVTAQDLLALDASARMNTPGTSEGNWLWRLTPSQLDALPMDWLRERGRVHGRG